MSTPAILAPYPSGTPRIATVLFPFVLTVKLLTTQIETAATAALTREERLEQTRERREITRLNQKLARSVKLRDDSLATHHTAKEPGRRLPQRVLRRSFPGHEMTCVDDRSEEHTSELQSLAYLVCRLLLEKKKTQQ